MKVPFSLHPCQYLLFIDILSKTVFYEYEVSSMLFWAAYLIISDDDEYLFKCPLAIFMSLRESFYILSTYFDFEFLFLLFLALRLLYISWIVALCLMICYVKIFSPNHYGAFYFRPYVFSSAPIFSFVLSYLLISSLVFFTNGSHS